MLQVEDWCDASQAAGMGLTVLYGLDPLVHTNDATNDAQKCCLCFNVSMMTMCSTSQ